MTRVVLVGAGEVGSKHMAALGSRPGTHLVAVADPAPHADVAPGVPRFLRWQDALARNPDLVVVATPPGIALRVARAAARNGARVLVEKPVVISPAELRPVQEEDARIFVAFQPHFAPGLPALLAASPAVRRIDVSLSCRRDRPYFRTWRTSYATAGGVLHQQAIHGLALALRLLPDTPIVASRAQVIHVRQWSETEDRVSAQLALEGGELLTITARVDADNGAPHHHVVVHCADGRRLTVRGRNLHAGLGEPADAPGDLELRHALYDAVLADQPQHPALFPLPLLHRTLEVIDRVYRSAHVVRLAPAAA
ncbi:Gfo/Idh/MocA family protein [Streptomyces sp. NPDC087440]|uniref:Gfo/Idh/MocA family protein n=1 Tax=Streptomyces sp. NPDC087440 TaxID=3365790 RepID=UPI0037FDF645